MLKKIVLFVLLSFSFAVVEAAPPISSMRSAIILSDVQKITLLIAEGADVNAPDESGNTPLHLACKMWNLDFEGVFFGIGRIRPVLRPYLNNIAIVRVLLEAGANVYATNFAGNTPLHLASNQECIDLLNNHIEWLENRGRRTKGALRESSTETSEGASSPTALCHLQQNQQSVVDEPEDDEEAEEPNHVPAVTVEVTPIVTLEVTPTWTLEEGILAIDFDALLDL